MTGCDRHKPAETFHQHGLAAAVASDESVYFSAFKFRVDIIEDRRFSEAFCDVFQFDRNTHFVPHPYFLKASSKLYFFAAKIMTVSKMTVRRI
jgi:hypothetical protein